VSWRRCGDAGQERGPLFADSNAHTPEGYKIQGESAARDQGLLLYENPADFWNGPRCSSKPKGGHTDRCPGTRVSGKGSVQAANRRPARVRTDNTISTRPERITRRTLLGAAALEAAQGFAQASESGGPSRIIDTHTHFYDPTRPQGVPWPSKGESLLYRRTLPEDFRQAVRGLRVTGTVVVEASPWLDDNQWLLDLAKENPLIVGVVGHLEPGGPTFKSHLQRFAKRRLFRGIRIDGKLIAAGLRQPAFLSDLQRLADADLELDAIGESKMLTDLVTLCDRVPRLRIIINHLPFDPPGDASAGKEAGNALCELGRRPQVYAKVSGVLRRINGRVPLEASLYRQPLDQLWDTFGVDRLVYGSNWPVSNLLAPYSAVLDVVREYFLTKGLEPAEKYFWNNSVAAYKWVDNS